MEGTLICDHISLGYEGKVVAKDINFSLNDGDYLVVLGENGSGKTTLMKGILGLLKPMGGACHYHGFSQREIGYLPQQTESQKDFPASVTEVVMSGCLNHKGHSPFYGKKEKKRVAQMMEKLGLTAIRNKSFADLSGGQRQRVLLCRALLATSKLLVLDEPVAGLDHLVTTQMYEMIHKINKEDHITVIMISHDVAGSMNYCNRVLHMGKKPRFYEDIEQYKTTSQFERLTGGADND